MSTQPRPLKVYVLSATQSAIEQLARSYVLLIFYRCPPQFCFLHFRFFFFFVSKVLSFLLVVLLIVFFFWTS